MTPGRSWRGIGAARPVLLCLLLAAAPAALRAQQPPFEGALSPAPHEPREQLAQANLAGGELVLFGIHRGAALLLSPLLEAAVNANILGGTGSGSIEGLKIRPGSLGSNSGVGGSVGYVFYPAPVWGGVSVGATIKGYQEHSAFLGLRDERGADFVRVTGTYDLDTRDEFSGLGMDTPEDEETDYRQEEIRFLADGQVTTARYLRFGARGGYRRNNLLDGKDDDLFNTETVFGDDLVDLLPIPGLPRSISKYTQFGVFAAFDSRNGTGNPDRGVLLAGSFDAFRGAGGVEFDWNRWAGELSGYAPLPDETRVLAGRVLVVHQDPQEDQVLVPFYFLSSLGGSSFLRSFSSFRFQDNDLIYAAGEFRRRVWAEAQGRLAVDASLFVESGGVYRDVTDEASLGDMEQSFGTELRIVEPNDVVARIGVAVGSSEGAKFYVGGGGRF